mmetsp:Transcript_7393/g.15852  ORF Transcript_7393/g.15852 Transcript_7393/m.15852 type:complete len:257 (-) Transcript_7393:334-1104(-)
MDSTRKIPWLAGVLRSIHRWSNRFSNPTVAMPSDRFWMSSSLASYTPTSDSFPSSGRMASSIWKGMVCSDLVTHLKLEICSSTIFCVQESTGWSGTVTVPSTSTMDSMGNPAMYLTMAGPIPCLSFWKHTPCTVNMVDRILTKTPFPTDLETCRNPRTRTFFCCKAGVRSSMFVHFLLVTAWDRIRGRSPKLSAPTPASLSAFSFSRAARSARFRSFSAALAAFSAAFLARFSLFLSEASVTAPTFFSFFGLGGGP